MSARRKLGLKTPKSPALSAAVISTVSAHPGLNTKGPAGPNVAGPRGPIEFARRKQRLVVARCINRRRPSIALGNLRALCLEDVAVDIGRGEHDLPDAERLRIRRFADFRQFCDQELVSHAVRDEVNPADARLPRNRLEKLAEVGLRLLRYPRSYV